MAKHDRMKPFDTLVPNWDARVRDSFAQQSLMRTFNARITTLAPARCVIEADYADGLGQQHGFFHAGVASALGDSAAGYAAYTLLPDAGEVLTAEFKINLVAPAKGVRLVASGEVVRQGRRLTTCLSRIEVADANGKRTLCAIMLATIAVVKSGFSAGKPPP
jgi:uncharacterized protein (TIGR00369 family)